MYVQRMHESIHVLLPGRMHVHEGSLSFSLIPVNFSSLWCCSMSQIRQLEDMFWGRLKGRKSKKKSVNWNPGNINVGDAKRIVQLHTQPNKCLVGEEHAAHTPGPPPPPCVLMHFLSVFFCSTLMNEPSPWVCWMIFAGLLWVAVGELSPLCAFWEPTPSELEEIRFRSPLFNPPVLANRKQPVECKKYGDRLWGPQYQ